MKLDYKEKDGYLYPDVSVDGANRSLGKYGLMRSRYLREKDPLREHRMYLEGTLYPHLHQMQEQASERVEQMVQSMAEQATLPDRQTNPYQWAQEMAMLKAQAEEVVIRELICTG